jgi:hypothetical protein
MMIGEKAADLIKGTSLPPRDVPFYRHEPAVV